MLASSTDELQKNDYLFVSKFEQMRLLNEQVIKSKVKAFLDKKNITNNITNELKNKQLQKESNNIFRVVGQKNFILMQIVCSNNFHLTELILPQNNISSAQCLCLLEAPHLEKIDLDDNKIVSLRFLARIYFPKLKTINISNNKIKQLNSIQGWHFPKLEAIWLEWLKTSQITLQNLTCLLKLQSKSLHRIICKSSQRIPKINYQNIIHKKYQIIHFACQ